MLTELVRILGFKIQKRFKLSVENERRKNLGE